MIRRAAIAVLLGGFASGPVAAHELEGVWLFEYESNARADGSRVDVPGPHYDGVLIYTADGHVSATIMPRGRRWKVADATRAELHATVGEGSSTAYAGRYEVDAATHTVVHIPAVSADPSDIGKRLIRQFQVRDDKLELSGKWRYRGEELTFTVHWIRAATQPIPAN